MSEKISVKGFEDILLVDDRSVQRILRETANKDLAIALKSADQEICDKIYANMSERAKEALRKAMKKFSPVSLQEVEKKRSVIVSAMKQLNEKGMLVSLKRQEKCSWEIAAMFPYRTTFPLVFENVPALRFVSNKRNRQIFSLIKKMVAQNQRVLAEGILSLEDGIDEFSASFDKKDAHFVYDVFRTVIDGTFERHKEEDYFFDGDAILSTYLKNRVCVCGGNKFAKLRHQIIATAAFYCRKGLSRQEFELLLTSFLSDSLRTEYYTMPRSSQGASLPH